MDFSNTPVEIIAIVFTYLPVCNLKKVARLSKKIHNLISQDHILKRWRNLQFPLLKNNLLDNEPLTALQKSFNIFHKTIQPINFQEECALILKIEIIEKLINIKLPIILNPYTEIIAYLRCDSFPKTTLAKLLNVSPDIKKQIRFRLTLIAHCKDDSMFPTTPRARINVSINDLFKNIVPTNVKKDEFLSDNNLKVITLIILNEDIKIYYSLFNFEKEKMLILFNEVKNKFNKIYGF